ncbi:MAG: hypothetical protein BWY74_01799 [Firmicutes bacterium ADurb.Bin419]|nr:MAG: hypothetical protein BWY74_01799 [Firmicutes bacterium ADurb.Bin419]
MLQIYTITGVTREQEYSPLYLPNKRSRILNEKLGASFVGSNCIEPKRVGEMEIEIRSDVYALEAKNAINILGGKVTPVYDTVKTIIDSK